MGGAAADVVLRLVFLPGLLITAAFYTVTSFWTVVVVFPLVKYTLNVLGKKQAVADICGWTVSHWLTPYTFHIERFGGLYLEVTGEALPGNERALVACNHRTWMDSVIMFCLARRSGRDGDLKFLAKRTLLLFPVYGLGAYFTQTCVFIKRTSEKAKKKFEKVFTRLHDPNVDRPFWLISYFEGTRLTKKKLAESQGFAKKRDLPVLNNVLLPRTKGFQMILRGLGDEISAIYDITIGYEDDEDLNPEPRFLDTLSLFCFGKHRVVKVHQRRIDLKNVPTDNEEQMNEFLYKLYKEKDELLETFKTTGRFPGRTVPWKRETLAKTAVTQIVFFLISAAVLGTAYAILKSESAFSLAKAVLPL